jgi:hypothetical protein
MMSTRIADGPELRPHRVNESTFAGRDGFYAAVAAAPVSTLHLSIGGRPLQIDMAGSHTIDAIAPAFLPLALRSPPAGDAARLLIWAGDQYAHPVWQPTDGGPVRFRDGGLVSCQQLRIVEVFSSDGPMLMWGTPEAFESGDVRAHPASTALAIWLAHTDAQMLHVAGVGDAGGAALIVGAGGAGKSTSALACARRGMGFVGDDLCVVDTTGAPIVHALYATAKMTPESESRLNFFPGSMLGRTEKGKQALALDARVSILRSAPIKAIISLNKSSSGASAPQRLSAADVLRVLVPTALKAATGPRELSQWLRSAASLAREVPGYRIDIGWNLDAVAQGIQTAIDMGKRAIDR